MFNLILAGFFGALFYGVLSKTVDMLWNKFVK